MHTKGNIERSERKGESSRNMTSLLDFINPGDVTVADNARHCQLQQVERRAEERMRREKDEAGESERLRNPRILHSFSACCAYHVTRLSELHVLGSHAIAPRAHYVCAIRHCIRNHRSARTRQRTRNAIDDERMTMGTLYRSVHASSRLLYLTIYALYRSLGLFLTLWIQEPVRMSFSVMTIKTRGTRRK